MQAFTDPEFDLLVACCADSSGRPQPERIRLILSRPFDWARLLELADHHRVVPQAYGALLAFSHSVPKQHFDALRLRYRDNARKALWFSSELVRILDHLEAAGIKALPYKGPVLARTLYGEVTQRQFGDLDILILPADALKAKAALLELGYKTGLDLEPNTEPDYLETGYEYSFSSMNRSNLLELQWRIVPRFYSIDIDMADLFERAEEISLGDREGVAIQLPKEQSKEASANGAKDRARYSLEHPTRTLRAEDLLLVLCVHAAKHVWAQLSWLCDIAQLVKSQQLDWTTIQDEARRLGIERIVALNLLLIHNLLGTALPIATQERLRDDAGTTVLADEILRVIKRSTHYDTESRPYFRLMMRLRERWQDRARFLCRLAVTPSVSEWSAVRLPRPLHPLYRLVRLWRLAKRLIFWSPWLHRLSRPTPHGSSA